MMDYVGQFNGGADFNTHSHDWFDLFHWICGARLTYITCICGWKNPEDASFVLNLVSGLMIDIVVSSFSQIRKLEL